MFKMHICTSVPLDLLIVQFGMLSPLFSKPCLVLLPTSENYPGSATMVAGPRVGSVSVQPDVDASNVCVSSGLSFSHGPLTVLLTQYSQPL